MLNNNIRISVVNFQPIWGDKETNLDKIFGYIEKAEGTNLIVFPETALTGYDNEDVPKSEKMHLKIAETIPGPTTEKILELAKKHNMIIVFGMIERDKEEPSTIYNSVAVVQPSGETLSYRKIHLPGDEGSWATPGEKPLVFDTQWGPVGVSICYDTYYFPELIRYSRGKGARLHLNCTANCDSVYEAVPLNETLQVYAMINQLYIATAGMCGIGKYLNFKGGTSIVGTSEHSTKEVTYYAGLPFCDENGETEAIYTADLDLGSIEKRCRDLMFEQNDFTGRPDFAPDIYAKMYAEIAES